jgi:methylsterol monooxygenase/4-alpha-methyl-delta7-sterol-4alpha-methyl oxidase
MIQSYEGHCGYTWSWNTLSLFPYTVGSDFHDFHHAMNAGNYGSVFMIWDALFHTETPFIKFLEKEVIRKQSSK